MVLDLNFFLFAIPAVLFAGISKGGFGSGAAFAASPFLALIIEPKFAVGVMLPLLMLMDVTSLKPYWRKWDWRNARGLMLGGLPGILFGAAVFKVMNPDFLRLLIGIIAIGFVVFQLSRARGWISSKARPFKLWQCLSWGALAGFTSFVSHAGGPPAAIQLLGQRLSKLTYQATTVIVFWWMNLVKFIPYFFLGMFTRETVMANLYLAPVAIIGTLVGVFAHSIISERVFFSLTYIFLTVTGAKLIYDVLF